MVDISVLIPTYNRVNYLKRAINSIQSQTLTNIEILIYDDGSTDNTKGTLKLLAMHDKRITYFSIPNNKGVSQARNALLNHCRTPYAVFQDSDDVSNKYRLEELWSVMQKTPVPVVNSCFDAYHGDDVWLKKPKEEKTNWKFYNRGGGATVMFDVSKAVEFDESLSWGEDSLWRDTMNNKYGKEVLIHKVLYYVDFSSKNRLGGKHREKGYISGRGIVNDNN